MILNISELTEDQSFYDSEDDRRRDLLDDDDWFDDSDLFGDDMLDDDDDDDVTKQYSGVQAEYINYLVELQYRVLRKCASTRDMNPYDEIVKSIDSVMENMININNIVGGLFNGNDSEE